VAIIIIIIWWHIYAIVAAVDHPQEGTSKPSNDNADTYTTIFHYYSLVDDGFGNFQNFQIHHQQGNNNGIYVVVYVYGTITQPGIFNYVFFFFV
jgi:hypothetical protein